MLRALSALMVVLFVVGTASAVPHAVCSDGTTICASAVSVAEGVTAFPSNIDVNQLAGVASHYSVIPTRDTTRTALCPIASRTTTGLALAEAGVSADMLQHTTRTVDVDLGTGASPVEVGVVNDLAIATEFLAPTLASCGSGVAQDTRRAALASALGMHASATPSAVGARLWDLSLDAQLSPAVSATSADAAQSAIQDLQRQLDSAAGSAASVGASGWIHLKEELQKRFDRMRSTPTGGSEVTGGSDGGEGSGADSRRVGAAQSGRTSEGTGDATTESPLEEWAAAHNFNVSDLLGGSISPNDLPTEASAELQAWLDAHNVSIPAGESLSEWAANYSSGGADGPNSDLPSASNADIAEWLQQHNFTTDDQGAWDSHIPVGDPGQLVESLRNASARVGAVLSVVGVVRAMVARDRTALQYGWCVEATGRLAPVCPPVTPTDDATASTAAADVTDVAIEQPPLATTSPPQNHAHHTPDAQSHPDAGTVRSDTPVTTGVPAAGADHQGAPPYVKTAGFAVAIAVLVVGGAVVAIAVRRNRAGQGRRQGQRQALSAANELAAVASDSDSIGSEVALPPTMHRSAPATEGAKPDDEDDFGALTEV